MHNFYEGNTALSTNGTVVSVMKLKPLLDPNRNEEEKRKTKSSTSGWHIWWKEKMLSWKKIRRATIEKKTMKNERNSAHV